jgi:hypothetical protein
MAVCATLQADRLGDRYDPEWPPSAFRTNAARAASRELGLMLTPEELVARGEELHVFTLVRHPLDRLVSCWTSKIDGRNADRGLPEDMTRVGLRPKMPFATFVRAVSSVPDWKANPHFRSQATFVNDEVGRNIASTVLRFENLPGCLIDFFADQGLPGIDIPHLLKSSRPPWHEFYDSETRRLATERYEGDFDQFGYEHP